MARADFKVTIDDSWLREHGAEWLDIVRAETLEEAAEDFYGDTHIPGLSAATWLRIRASACRANTLPAPALNGEKR